MVLVLNAKFFATRPIVTGWTWVVAGDDGLPGTVVVVGSGVDAMEVGAWVAVCEGVTVATGVSVSGPVVVLHPAAPRKHAISRKSATRYNRLFIKWEYPIGILRYGQKAKVAPYTCYPGVIRQIGTAKCRTKERYPPCGDAML